MGADTTAMEKKYERNSMNMTTTTEKHRLGRHPGQQGPRPQLINRNWVEKLDTGNKHQPQLVAYGKKIMMAKKEITIGTWNVRTLWAAGQLELLRREMEKNTGVIS